MSNGFSHDAWMAAPFNGFPSRAAWFAASDAANAAFNAALDGYDYGNLMESRMVSVEMAAGGDASAAEHVALVDSMVDKANAARDAVWAAAKAALAGG